MAEIKWIKLSVNMFDDEKIKLIRTMPEGDSIALIWIQILCHAGKINDGGLVYMGQNLAYSPEMLATILDHPVNTIRLALNALQSFDMIEVDSEGTIDVLNWEKHQSTDKMAQLRKQNRDRKRKYDLREKLRRIGYDPNENDVPDELEELEEFVSNVTVTLSNDTEVRSKKLEERSKKLDKDKPSENKFSNSQLKELFEDVWKEYPRKESKQVAMKAYIKALKELDSESKQRELAKLIKKQVNNYKTKVESERTEPRFIATGGVWFNQQRWTDEIVVPKELGHTGNAPKNENELVYDDETMKIVNDMIDNGERELESFTDLEQAQINQWRVMNGYIGSD